MPCYSDLNCIFLLAIIKTCSLSSLIVLRRDIAPVSCFVTLLTDVLMVVSISNTEPFLNHNHADYKT